MPLTPVLTQRWGESESWKLTTYERLGGYEGLRRALDMEPAEVIATVKEANLRGRGGAGFPAGMKWSFMPDPESTGRPNYLVVNADEGEPGTCRDAPLMMADPHVLIEGIIIAAYAMRAHRAFIYLRGELVHARRRLDHAVREAYEKGYLGRDVLDSGFHLDLLVHSGAGAYEAGEETALLDSLEGSRAQPRLKPPFPAQSGLYGMPTTVNNVGTLSSVPWILRHGSDWWLKMGPEKAAGTSIYSLSGRVRRPGQYEAPLGTTLRELLDMAGGVREGHELKFWTPGGSSTPMFTAEHLDVPLDFDSVAQAGSLNGTSAVMIFDDSDCVVRAAKLWCEFYAHESCGKCTPCREGTFWYVQIYERLERGDADAGDIDTLLDLSDNILGRALCALGDGAVSPVTSSIQHFRDEYVAHYERGGCPFAPDRTLVGAHA